MASELIGYIAAAHMLSRAEDTFLMLSITVLSSHGPCKDPHERSHNHETNDLDHKAPPQLLTGTFVSGGPWEWIFRTPAGRIFLTRRRLVNNPGTRVQERHTETQDARHDRQPCHDCPKFP
jgi:hypothetical protein